MLAVYLTLPEPSPAALIVLLVWGVADCFWGYRIFRVAVALTSALVGGWLLAAGAVQLGVGEAGRWLGFAVGALLGAVAAVAVVGIGVFLLGFAFGCTVAVGLLPVMGEGPLLLAAGVGGLAAGLLALALQRILISAATAWMGAFRATLAVAGFGGALPWPHSLLDPGAIPALVLQRPWISAVALVLGAVGFGCQLARHDPAARRGA